MQILINNIQTNWNTPTNIVGVTLNTKPNLFSWNITFDTPFFHDKVEKYYKKLIEQYEEEEFNKFIGLSK